MNGGGAPAVDARALSFSVEAKMLLDHVDMRAERGQFVGLIGANGAGKSTLLRALSGVLRYQEGAVSLEGSDLQSMPARDVAATLALVPQIAPYTQGFTAFELVVMGRYPHLGRFQVEGEADDRIAREAMRRTETEQFAARTLDTLSGGERQRVFLARALAQQPRVLLLDEPTSNLDILHQLKILGLVRQLVDDGLTAIAAIHDLNLAARYCDRLVLLNNGQGGHRGGAGRGAGAGDDRVGLRRAVRHLPRPGDGRAGDQPDWAGGRAAADGFGRSRPRCQSSGERPQRRQQERRDQCHPKMTR